MVTVAEALAQVEEGEESARLRELEIGKAETSFGSLRQRGSLTEQFSIGGQVGLGGVGRELKRRRRVIGKEKRRGAKVVASARGELASFRGRLSERRSEIARVKAEQEAIARERAKLESDIAVGRKAAARGGFAFGESKRAQEIAKGGLAKQRAFAERAKLISELKAVGLTPIFETIKEPGKPLQITLGGFESDTLRQTIPFTQAGVETIRTGQPKGFQTLVDLDIISLGKPEIVPTIDVSQPSTFVNITQPDIPLTDPQTFIDNRTIIDPLIADVTRFEQFPLGKDISFTRDTDLVGISTPTGEGQVPVGGNEIIFPQSTQPPITFTDPTLSGFTPGSFSGLPTIGSFGLGGFQPISEKLFGAPDIQDVQEQGKTFKQRVDEFSLRSAEQAASQSSFLGVSVFGIKEPRFVTEIKAGILSSVIPTTKTELALTGVSLGVGALVGGGLRIGGTVLKTLAPRLQPFASGAATLTGVGLTTLFVAEKGEQFITAPTSFSRGEVLGSGIRELGAFGTGIVAGTKISSSAIGRIRTIGLTELSSESIIAPEFPTQTFPTIKKGQTAGQLLGEFGTRLPGETRPGGFTASDVPIAELSTRRGTSELPGLFQAPDVSPRFLRITSEQDAFSLFGIDPFGGGRPSILRVTPDQFRLTPFISSTQKNPLGKGGLKQTQEFFETAPKGTSFVPFIKTEKEAIIPFGTELIPKRTRFFTRFQGERIPIFEFETGGGLSTGTSGRVPRTVSVADLSRSLRPIRSSIFNPTSSGFFGAISSPQFSSARLISSREFGGGLSSRLGTSRRSPGRSSLISPSISTVFPSSRPSRRPSRRPRIIPSFIPSSRLTIFPSIIPLTTSPLSPPPIKDSKRRKVKKKKTKKGRRSRTPVGISFTAQVLNLKGRFPTPKIKGLGLLPTQLRVIPR